MELTVEKLVYGGEGLARQGEARQGCCGATGGGAGQAPRPTIVELELGNNMADVENAPRRLILMLSPTAFLKLPRSLLVIPILALLASCGGGQASSARLSTPPAPRSPAPQPTRNYRAFPSLVRLTDGTLLAVYRVGSGHASNDGSIVLVRMESGSKAWGPEVVILDGMADQRDYQEASIAVLSSGKLIMAYFTQEIGSGRNYCYTITSGDGGRNWSSPVPVAAWGGDNAMSAPAVELADGNLLLPVYGRENPAAHWQSAIAESTDTGLTWKVLARFNSSPDADVSEPNIVPLGGSSLLATLRNDLTHNTEVSTSSDGGATWKVPRGVFLSNSRASMTRLASGAILAVFRSIASPQPVYGAYRVCYDNGASWGAQESLLDLGPAGTEAIFEYGSSAEIAPNQAVIMYGMQASATESDIYTTTVQIPAPPIGP